MDLLTGGQQIHTTHALLRVQRELEEKPTYLIHKDYRVGQGAQPVSVERKEYWVGIDLHPRDKDRVVEPEDRADRHKAVADRKDRVLVGRDKAERDRTAPAGVGPGQDKVAAVPDKEGSADKRRLLWEQLLMSFCRPDHLERPCQHQYLMQRQCQKQHQSRHRRWQQL